MTTDDDSQEPTDTDAAAAREEAERKATMTEAYLDASEGEQAEARV